MTIRRLNDIDGAAVATARARQDAIRRARHDLTKVSAALDAMVYATDPDDQLRAAVAKVDDARRILFDLQDA